MLQHPHTEWIKVYDNTERGSRDIKKKKKIGLGLQPRLGTIIYLLDFGNRGSILIATLRPLSYFVSKYKGPSSMGCRKHGSHARGVHTQYLAYENTKSEARGRSRNRINSKSSMKYGKGHKRYKEEKSQTRPN